MTPNDVQLRKLRKRFRLLDTNGNGRLDLSDYLAVAHRFQHLFALAPGSDRAVLIEDTYTRLFHAMHRHGDHNADGHVDEQEFVDTSVASLLTRPDGFDRAVRPVVDAVARVCDKDGDAALSRDEFRRLLLAEGAREEDCDLALAHLYPNGTPHLDLAGFTRATREFYCSPDPASPGNWLLGAF
jgi:Ca2+-binding EF-hand superfamily protein